MAGSHPGHVIESWYCHIMRRHMPVVLFRDVRELINMWNEKKKQENLVKSAIQY
jgi:hypothetical protein